MPIRGGPDPAVLSGWRTQESATTQLTYLVREDNVEKTAWIWPAIWPVEAPTAPPAHQEGHIDNHKQLQEIGHTMWKRYITPSPAHPREPGPGEPWAAKPSGAGATAPSAGGHAAGGV